MLDDYQWADRDRDFVDWTATFDCVADEHDRWTTHFNDRFARWLGSLARATRRLKARARSVEG